jgi:segregation and condensation protein B
VEAEKLSAALEAVLFVSEEGASLEQLAQLFELPEEEVSEGLALLRELLSHEGGLQVVCLNGLWRMVTRPEVALWVEKFLARPPARLSPAAMVTLAIIAYRQPITRPEVEELRGVNSAYLVDRLERRGLIRTVGRKDAPGKPRLYGTTELFLQALGLSTLEELPRLPALEGEALPEPEELLPFLIEADERAQEEG